MLIPVDIKLDGICSCAIEWKRTELISIKDATTKIIRAVIRNLLILPVLKCASFSN
jgi:hypothetical protein